MPWKSSNYDSNHNKYEQDFRNNGRFEEVGGHKEYGFIAYDTLLDTGTFAANNNFFDGTRSYTDNPAQTNLEVSSNKYVADGALLVERIGFQIAHTITDHALAALFQKVLMDGYVTLEDNTGALIERIPLLACRCPFEPEIVTMTAGSTDVQDYIFQLPGAPFPLQFPIAMMKEERIWWRLTVDSTVAASIETNAASSSYWVRMYLFGDRQMAKS